MAVVALQEPACADQVHKVMTRAASNVRFNMPLASACADDREQYCGDVQPVRHFDLSCTARGLSLPPLTANHDPPAGLLVEEDMLDMRCVIDKCALHRELGCQDSVLP